MNYEKYIELGFERTDMNDSIEFKQTGYYGFSLEKKLGKKMSIIVNSGELDSPRMYIKRNNSDTYHIIIISEDCCLDLCINYQKKGL